MQVNGAVRGDCMVMRVCPLPPHPPPRLVIVARWTVRAHNSQHPCNITMRKPRSVEYHTTDHVRCRVMHQDGSALPSSPSSSPRHDQQTLLPERLVNFKFEPAPHQRTRPRRAPPVCVEHHAATGACGKPCYTLS